MVAAPRNIASTTDTAHPLKSFLLSVKTAKCSTLRTHEAPTKARMLDIDVKQPVSSYSYAALSVQPGCRHGLEHAQYQVEFAGATQLVHVRYFAAACLTSMSSAQKPYHSFILCARAPSHSSARACSRGTGRTKMPSLGASVKGLMTASGTCPGDSSNVNLHAHTPTYQYCLSVITRRKLD